MLTDFTSTELHLLWSVLDRTAEQQIEQRCKLSGTGRVAVAHIFSALSWH